MILIVICVGAIVLLWLLLRTNNKDYWKKRNVIQLHDVFVEFLFGGKSIAEIYKEIYENHPNEPYVGAFLMSRPALVLRDIQNIEAVLATDFESFHSRGINFNKNDILSDNVLSISNLERWKTIRQRMTPIFTSAKLKIMTGVIEKTAHDFVEMVKNHKEMRDNPFNALYTYTTASIGASIFGIDTQSKSTMDSPFLEMTWKAINPTFLGNLKFAMNNLSPTIFKMLQLTIFGNHEKFFIGAIKRVLEARRNNTLPVEDFIGLCMELQKMGTMKDKLSGYTVEPTDELLAAQAFIFFLAGTDTGANTMHFTLLELSNNPDILKRVHEEIDKNLKDTSNKIDYDVIDKFVYLDMVLSEAMRKYPPVGLFRRECMRDTVLPVGNLKVEKGVIIVTPVFALHRDEKLYPNPEKFDPERFAPNNVANLRKFGYLPFGKGKRICLGSRYARIQVLTGLALLLSTFTLKPQDYRPKHFEKSVFSLRDTHAKYELVLRDKED